MIVMTTPTRMMTRMTTPRRTCPMWSSRSRKVAARPHPRPLRTRSALPKTDSESARLNLRSRKWKRGVATRASLPLRRLTQGEGRHRRQGAAGAQIPHLGGAVHGNRAVRVGARVEGKILARDRDQVLEGGVVRETETTDREAETLTWETEAGVLAARVTRIKTCRKLARRRKRRGVAVDGIGIGGGWAPGKTKGHSEIATGR